MYVPHVNQSMTTLAEPLLTKLASEPFHLQMDVSDVHVQAGIFVVTVWTDSTTVCLVTRAVTNTYWVEAVDS